MSSTRFLTGITTSGTPHLGNYVGSIRPSVRHSLNPDVESFYFLADYHALIKIDDPARIQRSTLEIAASWLATGLDPERVIFYRQSDVPEIPELTWFLTCVIGKGVLNRAHAYKAAVDKNTAAGLDPDSDVSAGLFMYPVLMGADILMFNAHKVPVGRDQIQHIEMARDMAHSFNYRYGEHFVPPEAEIEESVATLPGLEPAERAAIYSALMLLAFNFMFSYRGKRCSVRELARALDAAPRRYPQDYARGLWAHRDWPSLRVRLLWFPGSKKLKGRRN